MLPLLAKLIRPKSNFVPTEWNNIIFNSLIAYEKNPLLPEMRYCTMSVTTDYGRPASGTFPSTWNDGEGQLSSNLGKQHAGETGEAMDPEFDSLTAALRQMHDSIANEPVPDDFLDLLDQIDAKILASKKFT